MKEKNDFQGDETRRFEENEESAIRSECSEAFERFAGHLQELLYCQDSLARVSFYTERLFKHHLLLQSILARPRARRIEGAPLGLWNVGSDWERQVLKDWEDNLDSLDGKVLPLVHPQIDGIHWQKIFQQSQALEDAVRRLCRTDDLKPDDIAEIQSEQHWLQTLREKDWRNRYRNEVWTFRALHHDIESLVPLIRAVAAICQFAGDFGDARERQSAARVAHISAQLTQCASDMAQDASFFSFYAERSPKSRLKNEQAWLLKDISLARHASRSLRGERKIEWDSYTPPVIAAMMKLTPKTVMKYIVEMEKRYEKRIDREIPAMEEEMKAEGKDPVIYTETRDAKVCKIKVEGAKELTPREKEGKSRRAFSWHQVKKIAHYYDAKHSRWINRKDREKRLPDSPE